MCDKGGVRETVTSERKARAVKGQWEDMAIGRGYHNICLTQKEGGDKD